MSSLLIECVDKASDSNLDFRDWKFADVFACEIFEYKSNVSRMCSISCLNSLSSLCQQENERNQITCFVLLDWKLRHRHGFSERNEGKQNTLTYNFDGFKSLFGNFQGKRSPELPMVGYSNVFKCF